MTSSVNLGHFHFHWEKRVEQAGRERNSEGLKGCKGTGEKEMQSSLIFAALCGYYCCCCGSCLLATVAVAVTFFV